MLKAKETVRPLSVVSEENSRIIWELMESVQCRAETENTKCDSLLNLARELGEVKEWTNQTTCV